MKERERARSNMNKTERKNLQEQDWVRHFAHQRRRFRHDRRERTKTANTLVDIGSTYAQKVEQNEDTSRGHDASRDRLSCMTKYMRDIAEKYGHNTSRHAAVILSHSREIKSTFLLKDSISAELPRSLPTTSTWAPVISPNSSGIRAQVEAKVSKERRINDSISVQSQLRSSKPLSAIPKLRLTIQSKGSLRAHYFRASIKRQTQDTSRSRVETTTGTDCVSSRSERPQSLTSPKGKIFLRHNIWKIAGSKRDLLAASMTHLSSCPAQMLIPTHTHNMRNWVQPTASALTMPLSARNLITPSLLDV